MSPSTRGPLAGTVALWVIAVVAVVFLLRSASQLFIPIVFAVLISYVLEPVVSWLSRHRVPRLAGASAVMLVLLGFCAWGVYSLRDDALRAMEALPEAARRAREFFDAGAGSGTVGRVQQAAQGVQEALQSDQGSSAQDQSNATGGGGNAGSSAQASDASGSQPGNQSQGAPGFLSGLQRAIQSTVGAAFTLVGNLTVIFFLVFFLLISGHHVRSRILEAAGSDAERRRRLATIVDEINSQVQRFLVVRLITAVIVGVLTWAALALMGVENAAVWGILAGVFNSIPYFGPIIVSGGLFIVGVVQGGGLTQGLQMGAVALAITSVEGWLLTPPLMGKAEGMSALAVFIGLLVWTWIWGGWGTILAVPMLVVMKAVADHTPSLRPLGRLMV